MLGHLRQAMCCGSGPRCLQLHGALQREHGAGHGPGGLFDIASEAPSTPKQDFGQTLGRWGHATGPYLVLPFWRVLPPVRDSAGLVVDAFGYPRQHHG